MQRLFCKKKLMSALGLMLGLVLLSAAPALAGYSTPEGAPSWWGAEDGNTVSLGWHFDNELDPLALDFKVAPHWYTGESWNIGPADPFSSSPQWYANVNDRDGVWGYKDESGYGKFNVLVDNQEGMPIKRVWYQIDYYLSSGNAWLGNGVSPPPGFEVSNWTEKDITLENGWRRLTVRLDILPQPGEELFWHYLLTLPGETAVIDQLHVSTHGVVPEPASLLLLGFGLLGLAGAGRKRKNQGVSSIV